VISSGSCQPSKNNANHYQIKLMGSLNVWTGFRRRTLNLLVQPAENVVGAEEFYRGDRASVRTKLTRRQPTRHHPFFHLPAGSPGAAQLSPGHEMRNGRDVDDRPGASSFSRGHEMKERGAIGEPNFSIRAYLSDARAATAQNSAVLVDVRSPDEFTGRILAPPPVRSGRGGPLADSCTGAAPCAYFWMRVRIGPSCGTCLALSFHACAVAIFEVMLVLDLPSLRSGARHAPIAAFNLDCVPAGNEASAGASGVAARALAA
jgi:rhodanese-related sulfurtransferase